MLNSFQQFRQSDSETIRNIGKLLNGHVALAGLDGGVVGAVHLYQLGELLLAVTALDAQLFDSMSEFDLQGYNIT